MSGYTVYLNGVPAGSTPATAYSVQNLVCGTTYTVAVDAVDAAGNHSPPASLSATTASCGDTTPPTQPASLSKTASTTTSISVGWTASTDNVAVTGYTVYKNGVSDGTSGTTSYALSGLSCGTTYTVSVDAFDAAGNRSSQASISAATSACADTTVPSVSVTAPVSGASVSGLVSVAASASDNVGVSRVEFWVDGVLAGTDAASPYVFSWDTTGVGDGAHTVQARAFDAAGNSASSSVSVTVANAPSCLTGGTVWQNQPFALQSGSFSFGFDATPSAAGIDAVMGLSSGAASDFTGLAAIVRFNGAGVIDARDGANYSAVNAIPYSAGTSYHFVLVVNVATHSYSAFVTPAGGTQALIGSGYAFRTEQASVAALSNLGVWAGVGSQAVCAASVSSSPDTSAPTAPGGLASTGATPISLSVSWNPSTDNVGVVGYALYLNGAQVGTTTGTSGTATGLSCGTGYTVAVDAVRRVREPQRESVDQRGNVGLRRHDAALAAGRARDQRDHPDLRQPVLERPRATTSASPATGSI